MTTKHTPGPWAPHLVDETIVVIPRRPLPQHISTLGHSEVADDEDYANARLIAAAPELLEALEGMVAEFGIHCDADSPLGAACAAIAKAKGEQPRLNAGLPRAAFPHMSPAEYLAQRLREDDEDLQDLMDRDMGG
ncbi:hypothetical protein [Achromobacter sp. UBA2119]|uniref:hypothetical protein n=1 Tax=Achromobacter sp. UBA2119 TaxID=1945911 RepID=UPI00257AB03D|nr:hypothetical protein [Achromobacter sp. UBA2119]